MQGHNLARGAGEHLEEAPSSHGLGGYGGPSGSLPWGDDAQQWGLGSFFF